MPDSAGPEASTAWSDEAEAVLLTEVEQRARDGDVHWGHTANVVRRATGYFPTPQEARERYEMRERERAAAAEDAAGGGRGDEQGGRVAQCCRGSWPQPPPLPT